MPDDSTDLDQSTTLTIVLQDENETDDSSPIRFEIEAQEGQELGPIVAQLAGLQQSGQLQQLVKMEGTINLVVNDTCSVLCDMIYFTALRVTSHTCIEWYQFFTRHYLCPKKLKSSIS